MVKSLYNILLNKNIFKIKKKIVTKKFQEN